MKTVNRTTNQDIIFVRKTGGYSKMILSTDERYKNIPLFVMQLNTTTDKLNFLD